MGFTFLTTFRFSHAAVLTSQPITRSLSSANLSCNWKFDPLTSSFYFPLPRPLPLVTTSLISFSASQVFLVKLHSAVSWTMTQLLCLGVGRPGSGACRSFRLRQACTSQSFLVRQHHRLASADQQSLWLGQLLQRCR